MADCSPPEGAAGGHHHAEYGATLTLSGKTVNNDTLTIREGDALLQEALLPVTAGWKIRKGTLTVSNTTTLTQKNRQPE